MCVVLTSGLSGPIDGSCKSQSPEASDTRRVLGGRVVERDRGNKISARDLLEHPSSLGLWRCHDTHPFGRDTYRSYTFLNVLLPDFWVQGFPSLPHSGTGFQYQGPSSGRTQEVRITYCKDRFLKYFKKRSTSSGGTGGTVCHQASEGRRW